jgi:hypothetical protein
VLLVLKGKGGRGDRGRRQGRGGHHAADGGGKAGGVAVRRGRLGLGVTEEENKECNGYGLDDVVVANKMQLCQIECAMPAESLCHMQPIVKPESKKAS